MPPLQSGSVFWGEVLQQAKRFDEPPPTLRRTYISTPSPQLIPHSHQDLSDMGDDWYLEGILELSDKKKKKGPRTLDGRPVPILPSQKKR